MPGYLAPLFATLRQTLRGYSLAAQRGAAADGGPEHERGFAAA